MSISTGPLPLRAAIPRPHRRELLAAALSGAQVVLLQPAAQGGVPRLQGVRQEGRRAALRLPHRLRRPDDARKSAAAQVHRSSRHRLLRPAASRPRGRRGDVPKGGCGGVARPLSAPSALSDASAERGREWLVYCRFRTKVRALIKDRYVYCVGSSRELLVYSHAQCD